LHVIGSFQDEDARDVFLAGCSRRFSSIARSAARRLADIDFANDVSELQDPSGNQLEKLKGDGAGQWSIRIDDQYRVCFVWDGTDAQDVEIVDCHGSQGSEVMIQRKATDRLARIHPGEFLREDFMKPLGLSANALALGLRVPATRISEIVNERRGISVDTAARLSLYFGTTVEYWLRMQSAYDVATIETELLPKLKKEVQRRVA